jgi:hypothetical protein
VFGYHYLKYVSLPRGHQSAVNIADILLQKNVNQTSRYTKMQRLVHILRKPRVTDINLRMICYMHHRLISINPHHGHLAECSRIIYAMHLRLNLLLAPIRGYWMVTYDVLLSSMVRGGLTVIQWRDIHLLKMVWLCTQQNRP